MSRQLWSRPVEVPVEELRHRPLYARALGVRHLNLSGLLCFLFFEGTIALALLLALAELVSWWGMVVLPGSVAAMVKINDVVAGGVSRPVVRLPGNGRAELRSGRRTRAIGRAPVPHMPAAAMPLRAAAPPLNVRPTGQPDNPIGRQRADRGGAPASPGQRARQSGAARYD